MDESLCNMTTTRNSTAPAFPSGNLACYKGKVVYIFSFDLAYDMLDELPPTLLGQELRQYVALADKRSPREVLFFRPQMVTLPPVKRTLPSGPVDVVFTVKIFPVGSISIAAHVPFQVADLDELVGYHDLAFAEGSLQSEVSRLAQAVRDELAPYCIRPVAQLKDEEAYTIFCIHAPLVTTAGNTLSGETWLRDRLPFVAALLTQEPNPRSLSVQEAHESTGKYLSYYEHDLAVIDWDAAVLLDTPEYFEDPLHIMELANVQLVELEAFDRTLDAAMTGSYRDLTAKRRIRRRKGVLESLRTLRVDLTRLSDEMTNSTKFLGDWHLARIYQLVAARFHLSEWEHMIDEKLRTLDSLYQLLKQDQLNWWMMVLEIMIVLLFIIDLVVLLVPYIRP